MPQRSSLAAAKLQTKRSTWTPLNHAESNAKVFDERRSLLAKWFDRWSDGQRKVVLLDLVLHCSAEQLCFLRLSVSGRLPLQAADFTRLLPRTLCLYLFSFLDPRSLCRCAQVSWTWRTLVELDQLWMPKCVRRSWCLDFTPTPFERGVWKRLYIQTVLQMLAPPRQQLPTVDQLEEVVVQVEEPPATSALSGKEGSTRRRRTDPPPPPPWRDSDKRPKDIIRFNYLDNADPNGHCLRARGSSQVSTCSSKAELGGRRSLSDADYKLRKAKSLMFLTSSCEPQHPPPPPAPPPPPPPHDDDAPSRPHWTCCSHECPVAMETARGLLQLARWNAGIRPGPARTAVPRMSAAALRAAQRQHRSAPSTSLFDVWPPSATKQ